MGNDEDRRAALTREPTPRCRRRSAGPGGSGSRQEAGQMPQARHAARYELCSRCEGEGRNAELRSSAISGPRAVAMATSGGGGAALCGELLDYKTEKFALTRNRRVGLLHRLLQLAVLGYVLG